MEDQNNGWNEYSRLVLKELETLAKGISDLSKEIQDLKKEIAIIKDREDKVDKLQVWRDRIGEIISPSQLQEMVLEIKMLKEFKNMSMTVFGVVQIIMGLLMWWLTYSKK